jgi:pimeloyl-ACP methyl ester carboxylesterase
MRAATSPSEARLDATARWALGPSPRIPDRYRDWFTCAMAAVAPPPPVARPTSTPTRLLRSIAAPTLVVLGNDDHLAGPARRVAARAAQLPDVTIRVLSSGHLVNIERAPVVNRLLVDHLSRKAASSARTRPF